MLVIGLLFGPLVDRLSRRRVMIASDLVRCAVFAALLFAPNEIVIVVLAGVAGFATGFFRPAVYAGMPNLVREEDLPHANSLFQSVENLTWLAGPLIGGVLLTVSGPDVPYAANSVSFLLSAALVAAVPERLLQAGRAESEGHLKDLAAGFALVVRSRPLVTVLVVWTIVMFGNAGINVAEVALAKVSLDAGNVGLGVLMACAGLGLMLGSISAGGWLERSAVATVYGSAIWLMAIGFAAAAVSPTVWVAAICVVVSGFGNGVASVCNPYLVQQGAPDELRGRAFTVIMSTNAAALGLGMAMAGPFVDAAGARWVWGTAAGLYAVSGLLGLVLARGVREAEPKEVPPAELGPVAAADPAFGPTQPTA
jgi:MFS family permease